MTANECRVSFCFVLLFIWLHRVLVVACGLFDLCGDMRRLSCSMWALVS